MLLIWNIYKDVIQPPWLKTTSLPLKMECPPLTLAWDHQTCCNGPLHVTDWWELLGINTDGNQWSTDRPCLLVYWSHLINYTCMGFHLQIDFIYSWLKGTWKFGNLENASWEIIFWSHLMNHKWRVVISAHLFILFVFRKNTWYSRFPFKLILASWDNHRT